MSEVKSQGHIVHPVSNRCTSFLFHINQTNPSWDMSNKVFDLEKTHPKVFFMNVRDMTVGQGHPQVTQYILQTHTFFVPNILGIAQKVLTWEAKVIAAAADADAAAETNWKHKVTPDWGDLMMRWLISEFRLYQASISSAWSNKPRFDDIAWKTIHLDDIVSLVNLWSNIRHQYFTKLVDKVEVRFFKCARKWPLDIEHERIYKHLLLGECISKYQWSAYQNISYHPFRPGLNKVVETLFPIDADFALDCHESALIT